MTHGLSRSFSASASKFFSDLHFRDPAARLFGGEEETGLLMGDGSGELTGVRFSTTLGCMSSVLSIGAKCSSSSGASGRRSLSPHDNSGWPW